MKSLKLQYSQEWNIWYNMKYRCGKHKNYLDVTVCEDWQDFAQFLADMGPRPSAEHSIDRIDPYGNYEPKNCRWATQSTQRRNQRHNQDNETNGYWYWLDVARQNGISTDTFRARVGKMGLDWEYAATVKRVPGSGRPKTN